MSSTKAAREHASPADFPPDVDPGREFVKHSLDGPDERIEVGVAIVGGGTAGLACANRLMQLLGDDLETAERLGEVPVAVIEKAKICGGHNLSGAVMRPGPLEELFPNLGREDWRREGFAFGEVRKEAIYLLPNGKRKLRIPPPPPLRNHGNEVISVSALCRYMQRQVEEAGAYVLTETSATQVIVSDGAVLGGSAPATRDAGKRVRNLPTSSRAPTSPPRPPPWPRAAGVT
jgi:electron-transferring-flavoprotein dehydrogenase